MTSALKWTSCVRWRQDASVAHLPAEKERLGRAAEKPELKSVACKRVGQECSPLIGMETSSWKAVRLVTHHKEGSVGGDT